MSPLSGTGEWGSPVGRLKKLMASANCWQFKHPRIAVPWAVLTKFNDDQANLMVVALAWYGFTAIYPLLLVIVTVFGFIGVGSLGSSVVTTLHQFPVIGAQFTPGNGGSSLHGSTFGLVVGLVGLLYGAQGVTQTAQTAMNRVWNVPQIDRPGFLPRLGRSVASLACIGGAFLINAFVGSLALGLIDSFGGRYMPASVPGGEALVIFGVLLVVLLFRPTGLLGRET